MKGRGHTGFKLATVGAGVALATAAIGLALGVGSTRTAADRPPPDLEIRGEAVDVERFSLSTLHDREVLEAIEVVRVETFDDCMADRGFVESPTADPDLGEDAYTLAFEEAAYGADAWVIGPPTVQLPDGTTTSDGVVWQPGSCAYAQDASFGIDPYLREALRYRIMLLSIEADRETIADQAFDGYFDAWSECSGSDDAVALLEALDPPSDSTGDIRPGRRDGSAERQCLTPEQRTGLAEVRGLHHAWIADDNLAVVSAWVDIIDEQADATLGS